MPISPQTITTAAVQAFVGDKYVQVLGFKNGAAAGSVEIIYLKDMGNDKTEVSSTDYQVSLKVGEGLFLESSTDGDACIGPWRAVSTSAGGIVLEVLALYASLRSRL